MIDISPARCTGQSPTAARSRKALQKCLRSLDVISRKLSVPNAERIFFIRHALRAGFSIEEIFNLTKIDRWFLVQIKEIVNFEEVVAGATN
jgi:Carbamoyl-phosphate synthetase large chain, oligomerisation domain